jgi:NAD/NADP transhydrogenase alpha subunit
LYAKNVFNFLSYIQPQLEKNELDNTDEILKSTLITDRGEIVNPAVKQALQQAERV